MYNEIDNVNRLMESGVESNQIIALMSLERLKINPVKFIKKYIISIMPKKDVAVIITEHLFLGLDEIVWKRFDFLGDSVSIYQLGMKVYLEIVHSFEYCLNKNNDDFNCVPFKYVYNTVVTQTACKLYRYYKEDKFIIK